MGPPSNGTPPRAPSPTSGQALVCPRPPDGQGGPSVETVAAAAAVGKRRMVPVTSARSLPAALGIDRPVRRRRTHTEVQEQHTEIGPVVVHPEAPPDRGAPEGRVSCPRHRVLPALPPCRHSGDGDQRGRTNPASGTPLRVSAAGSHRHSGECRGGPPALPRDLDGPGRRTAARRLSPFVVPALRRQGASPGLTRIA